MRILLLGLIIVASLTLWFEDSRKWDPLYRGVPISTYFDQLAKLPVAVERFRIRPSRGGMSRNWESASEACNAIRSLGESTLPQLLSRLHARSTWLSRGCGQLGRLGFFPKAMREIEDRPSQRRQSAIVALAMLGPKGSAARPEIVSLLRDPATRTSSLCILQEVGLQAEQDILEIAMILQDRTNQPLYEMVNSWCLALNVLATSGPRARCVLPIVTEHLSSPFAVVRACAALAVASIGGPSDRAVEAMLADAVRQVVVPGPDSFPPMFSLLVLGEFGSRAAVALPRLKQIEATNPEQSPMASAAREVRLKIQDE